MPAIGEGSSFVTLIPGALETLVSNIRSGFAPSSHTHGTSGIEDGAVTSAKLSADVLASLGVSSSDLYDVLYDDATGTVGSVTLAKAVTGYSAEPYKRIVIYYCSTAGSQSTKYYHSLVVEMTSTMQYSERNLALCIPMCSGSTYYQYFSMARLSGSNISRNSEYQFAINGSSNKVTVTTANADADKKILITRVEGWKV